MMNSLFAAIALAVCLCTPASAQVKITELPSGTPAGTDVVAFVATSGTPTTKKATIADILATYAVLPSAVPPANKNGTGSKFQLFSGSFTANDCTKLDGDGNLVSAGAPCGGSFSLNGLTGVSQTFAKADDTNVTLTIGSASNTHTFTLGWTGTLAKARQHGSTVYTDQANSFSAGAQDFGSASSLKVPTGAGAAPTASGLIAYDSTADVFKGGAGGAGKTFSFTDHTHTLSQVTDAGTAAALNVPSSGNAASGEVVLGSDTRLADARTPTSHTHPFSDVTGAATNSQLPSTISSKTFDNTNTAAFKGSLFTLQDETDATKQARFDLSNITAGQTRTVNIPDANSTTAQAKSATANQFLTAMSAQGVFSAAQPAFSDLSGAATDAQVPNDITIADFSNAAHNHTNAAGGGQLTDAALSSAVSVAKGGTGQTSYTDGQLLIGNSTGNTLTKATLTAGSGISITNGGGSITVSATSATPTFTAPTLGTSWVYWGSGAQAGYTKTVGELVVLKGLIKGGASGSTIWTLPAGYRPNELLLFRCVYSTSTARVDVQADGQVVATGYTDPTQLLDLSCIRFVAQQ